MHPLQEDLDSVYFRIHALPVSWQATFPNASILRNRLTFIPGLAIPPVGVVPLVHVGVVKDTLPQTQNETVRRKKEWC